jgi:hypothetical protein
MRAILLVFRLRMKALAPLDPYQAEAIDPDQAMPGDETISETNADEGKRRRRRGQKGLPLIPRIKCPPSIGQWKAVRSLGIETQRCVVNDNIIICKEA